MAAIGELDRNGATNAPAGTRHDGDRLFGF
jgi:hypothetical protein